MIKIKAEQKYITLLLYVILITILAGIYIFLCKIHGKNFQIENCIFIAIFILVIIFNLINSSEYVSEIRISHSHIEIIYKKGLIESKREIIFKNDIVSFESIATINKNIISRRNEIKSNTLIKINLTDKKCIKFLVDSTNRLYGCPYQFILDLIKFSREIPNFKYEILGNYYFAKKDIVCILAEQNRQYEIRFQSTPTLASFPAQRRAEAEGLLHSLRIGYPKRKVIRYHPDRQHHLERPAGHTGKHAHIPPLRLPDTPGIGIPADFLFHY